MKNKLKKENKIDNLEEEFFNQLAEVLEENFPKGERCQCGRELPC
jgi:hypothetical protein